MKIVYLFRLLFVFQRNILQSYCGKIDKAQNKRLDSLESEIDELSEEIVLLKEQNVLQQEQNVLLQEQIDFLETLQNITGMYHENTFTL